VPGRSGATQVTVICAVPVSAAAKFRGTEGAFGATVVDVVVVDVVVVDVVVGTVVDVVVDVVDVVVVLVLVVEVDKATVDVEEVADWASAGVTETPSATTLMTAPQPTRLKRRAGWARVIGVRGARGD
jgi:hypothetical protein